MSKPALRNVPPELVLFDVDGTLNGVELWWPDLIRKGVAEFATRAGIELVPPDDRQALAVVGAADRDVWSPFLPLDQQHRWAELREHVLPMEVELLCSGRDFLYPGVVPLLDALRDQGCKIALASNCPGAYMDAIADGQGLRAKTDWQFCLDSPGVGTKADMLRLAMEAAGTEKAVMVGDRHSDHRAALANGLPFIWRTNDLCEISDADGIWDGPPNDLLTLLGLIRIS